MFKRGAVRTVEAGKRQKHSGISDLRVGLCFQPTFDDSDDEDAWVSTWEDAGGRNTEEGRGEMDTEQ